MIRGVAITQNRKPTPTFCLDWRKKMADLKAADPTLTTYPLPAWLEIVDAEGLPTLQFVGLTRTLDPVLAARERIVDARGGPSEYLLGWWEDIE